MYYLCANNRNILKDNYLIKKGEINMQKVAIVTGASRGIGKACAKKLALEGIKVIVNYNKSQKQAEELKEELEKQGIEIDLYKADVSKREEVKDMINYVLGKYKKIDILINNARNITNKVIYRLNR